MKWSPLKIIGAIVLILVILYVGYRLYHHYNWKRTHPATTAAVIKNTTTNQSNSAPNSNIYMMKTGPKGTYLTDFEGKALYIYDKDTTGVSNCTGSCLTNWPAYTSGATAEKTFPENITVITRSDGSKQFAWKGMPLYYFAQDTKPGDATGDGVGGFSLAK